MEINSNLFSRPLKKLQVPVDYSDDWLPEGTQTDGRIWAGTSRKEVMEWGILGSSRCSDMYENIWAMQ